jgi:hypothetical protein
VAGGWSQSARSRNRRRHARRPGTIAHDRRALADDHRVDGSGRDSDGGAGPLHLNRRRRAPPLPVALPPARARSSGTASPGSSAHCPHPAARRSDRDASRRRDQFSIVPAAARGSAQSGFQRDRIRPCRRLPSCRAISQKPQGLSRGESRAAGFCGLRRMLFSPLDGAPAGEAADRKRVEEHNARQSWPIRPVCTSSRRPNFLPTRCGVKAVSVPWSRVQARGPTLSRSPGVFEQGNCRW